jgi:hypothetical protein
MLMALTPAVAQAPAEAEIDALETNAPALKDAQKVSANTPTSELAVPVRTASQHQTSNLFASHSWYTPPPPPPQRAPPPPPEPTAPPLPFAYMGSYEQDGATVFFLVRGDRTYDVRVGDVIDSTYSVDSVNNGQLMFTYLPMKTSQSLQVGAAR